jgi:Polysaccharide pyruvyl transferase
MDTPPAPFAPQARIVPDTGFGAEALVPQDASASFGALCQEAGLKGDYVVCQASHRLTQNPAIASFLHRLADGGLQLLELPISPILGDRAGVLDLPLNVARLSRWPAPHEIVELIARSRGVIAQSLHLSIVAAACGLQVHRPTSDTGDKYEPLRSLPEVIWYEETTAAQVGSRRAEAASAPIRERRAQLAAWWDEVADLTAHRPSSAPTRLPTAVASALERAAAERAENEHILRRLEDERDSAREFLAKTSEELDAMSNRRVVQLSTRAADRIKGLLGRIGSRRLGDST